MLISYTVTSITGEKILDWRIQELNPPEITFREFFGLKLENDDTFKSSNYKPSQLHAVYVGVNKFDCSLVEDIDLCITNVLKTFGYLFVKFVLA